MKNLKKLGIIFGILFTTISFGQQRAVFVDGEIKVFNQLPKVWVTPTGSHNGFRKSSEEFIYSFGIRNVVQPKLTDNQKIDTIYFDVQNDYFTYSVKEFTQAEIDTLKVNKIEQLKSIANFKFQETQWYYDREVRLKKGNRPPKNVPQNIIDRDMRIYTKTDSLEIVINGLTTYKEIRNYIINLNN